MMLCCTLADLVSHLGVIVRETVTERLTLPRLKPVGFSVQRGLPTMRRSFTLSPSVTSRVPHGSLDVDARLGFRCTRPRSRLQVLPTQRFVGGTPHPRPALAGRQEPRRPLSPRAILAHLPYPPGADVRESLPRHSEATIPERGGFYSSPTPPRFYEKLDGCEECTNLGARALTYR